MDSVDPSELLTHTTWLRQLARSLVHEGADDLVQETWIAALRRPPHGERGLRPWLRTVITNAARLRWRSDAHRAAREQIAATLNERDMPAPDELLERHELQQLLSRLVSELDEPFRSTILLRFAEGLTPSQIARRLAIPAGTVRWRLKEALARLRVQLDSLHRDDRRAWIVALTPLAKPHTPAAAPVIAFAIAAAAVCAVVALVVVALLPSSTSAPAGPVSARNGQAQSIAHPAATTSSAGLSWLAQEGAPSRTLTGRVRMNAAPVSGATVRLQADPLSVREVTTDANGRFDFGQQIPREYAVGAYVPGKLAAIRRVDLRDPAATNDVELVIEDCTASLYGTVADAAGTPIEGAHVLREGMIGAETDRTGNYELCVLPTAALVAEIRVVVRADGFGTLEVPMAPPGRLRHDFVLAPESTVVGRVLGPNGSPMVAAQVAIDLTGPEASAPPERGVSLASVTDVEGRFRIAGLAAGAYRIAATSADAVTLPVELKLEAAENRSIDLRAVSTGIVRGRVRSRGVPIAGVTVAAGSEMAVSQSDGSFVLARVPIGEVELNTRPYKRTSGAIHVVQGDRNTAEVLVEPMGVLRGTVRRHGEVVPFARVGITGPSRVGVTADALGRYEARGLEPGKYDFYCDDRRRGAMFAGYRAVDLGPAETREHDIDLVWGGVIAGHVVDGRGDPVPGVAVSFRGGMSSQCLSDTTGAFACNGLAGDTYVATVYPASGVAHPFRFVEAPPGYELRDGDARIDGVRLAIEPAPYAIEGTVADRYGAPVSDVAVRAYAVEITQRGSFQGDLTSITDEDGQFRIKALSSGNYNVEVELRGLATRQTVTAGATGVSLVLDRPRCEGAHGREVPASLVRPPAPVVWNQQIELIGWSLPSTASANAPLEVTLVYRASKPFDRDWRVFAHFDSQSMRVNADHEPALGWCPTSQWKAGEIIVDRMPVQFAHAGRYALTIGFFTGEAPDWENLPVSAAPAAMETASHQGVRLGDIVVR